MELHGLQLQQPHGRLRFVARTLEDPENCCNQVYIAESQFKFVEVPSYATRNAAAGWSEPGDVQIALRGPSCDLRCHPLHVCRVRTWTHILQQRGVGNSDSRRQVPGRGVSLSCNPWFLPRGRRRRTLSSSMLESIADIISREQ